MSNIKRHKNRVRDIAILLSIFSMIYVTSSYNSAVIQGSLAIGITAIAAVFLVLIKRDLKINKEMLLIVLLLCLNVIITGFIKEDTVKDISIMLLVIIISYIFVIAINIKEYFEKYNRVIYVISSYSLVVYVLATLFPNVIRMFPSAYYRPTQEVYNLGLTFVNLRPSLIGNMGIFWEPGAFQTYLVIAILGEIFLLSKLNKKMLLILFLTLLTTWSTAGLINGAILIIIYLIHKNAYRKSKTGKVILSLTLFLLFLVISYQYLPYEYQYAFFGKITTFLSSDKSNIITSAYVRWTALTYPLKAFLYSPLLGAGYVGLTQSILEAGHTMTTNTPINWFASYGITFGVICFSGVYGLAKKMEKRSNLIKLLIFILILLSISTEQYLRNISILIFILYGVESIIVRSKKLV